MIGLGLIRQYTYRLPVPPGEAAVGCASSNKLSRSVPAPAAGPHRFAVLVADTVLFTYVHLRARHRRYGWTPEAARDAVTGLVANGYLPPPDAIWGATGRAMPEKRGTSCG